MPDPAGSLLRPCIGELLRTCYHPESLILRVDKIVAESASGDHETAGKEGAGRPLSSRIYRLLLTDGELSIQAAMNCDLHHLLENEKTFEGQLIRLRRYSLQRASRAKGIGHVLFLGIEEYDNVDAQAGESNKTDQKLEISQQQPSEPKGIKRSRATPPATPSKCQKTEVLHSPLRSDDASDSEDFETAKPLTSKVLGRRSALRDISGNHQLRWSARKKLVFDIEDADSKPDQPSEPVLQPELSTKPENSRPHDIKRHTLASLLDPDQVLPRRNYMCQVLAVITWVSSAILKRPGHPEKRHIKVHDPTIGKRYSGISISIFSNARYFRPVIGTVALFTGLTAQKWDGEVILNAYEKDCNGREWFIDDEEWLRAEGLEVDELRQWWAGRNEKKATDRNVIPSPAIPKTGG